MIKVNQYITVLLLGETIGYMIGVVGMKTPLSVLFILPFFFWIITLFISILEANE